MFKKQNIEYAKIKIQFFVYIYDKNTLFRQTLFELKFGQ